MRLLYASFQNKHVIYLKHSSYLVFNSPSVVHNLENFEDLVSILQNSKSKAFFSTDFCLHKHVGLHSVLLDSNTID